MKNSLPTAEQILEELSGKVLLKLDQLAPIAFQAALEEMTDYHRFLLSLNTTENSSGRVFSYAELRGNSFSSPHQTWIYQYNRLFDRAAEKLPSDQAFFIKLAGVIPILLPREGDPPHSGEIVRGILSLVLTAVHHLEAWRTKRRLYHEDLTDKTVTLAGSDTKVIASTWRELVSRWENVLRYNDYTFNHKINRSHDEDQWIKFRKDWSFISQHLQNTSNCLLVAVWNDDDAGASLLTETLIGWLSIARMDLDDININHKRLLSPNLLDLTWQNILEYLLPISYAHMPLPNPKQVFDALLIQHYKNVILITSSLLLNWCISEKAGALSGQTAVRLLFQSQRDTTDVLLRRTAGKPTFVSIFLDLIYLSFFGSGFTDPTYGGYLDAIVSIFDRMTEREILPGRIFTPSTLHGRGDLRSAFVIILAALISENDLDRSIESVSVIAKEASKLPAQDGSLRDILNEFNEYVRIITDRRSIVISGLTYIKSEINASNQVDLLLNVLRSCTKTIEDVRTERLKTLDLDEGKIERIRSNIEKILKSDAFDIPYLIKKKTRFEQVVGGLEFSIEYDGIQKADLVSPSMNPPSQNFEEVIAEGLSMGIGAFIWRKFCDIQRDQLSIHHRVTELEFWRKLKNLEVRYHFKGQLIVSRNTAIQISTEIESQSNLNGEDLSVDRGKESRKSGYFITINDINVFSHDLSDESYLFFSQEKLRDITFFHNANKNFVNLKFETNDGIIGKLIATFNAHFNWDETKILALSNERDSHETN